ncbi:small conductance mechanosensitive channel [Rhizobium sp. RU20A]|uniref:mechanosensitive ion channel domain-containing protein n=1 Tax=Rhizobium sp. RU20A TaxID=1907412 RepID=UPI000955B973|nr:mechanosensitive ion channel domain-containing protein [Rhizobium sp. RU20A]SIR37696.1 small conductance mechanosensitive channel [Rhizobium sp. RU20A]
MPFRRFAASLLFLLVLLVPLTPSHAQDSAQSTPPPASSVDDLVRILENEDARNALLTRLKNEAAAQQGQEPVEQEPTIARQIAEQTRAAAEQVMAGGEAVWSGVTALAGMVTGAGTLDYRAIQTLALNVILVGASLFAAFFVLRILAHIVQRTLDRRAASRHWSIRAIFTTIATLADIISVALAWGVGYVMALQVIGGATGRMDINQTLLLNAFLMVEMVKAAMRFVLQPRFPALRLVPVSDTAAAYWYFWLARAVSLVGYAFMFVAPILAANVSESAAQAVRVLVMLTALVIAIVVILQNRDRVRDVLSSRAAGGRTDFISRSGAFLAGVWHLVAIAYLIAIFVVWLVNPQAALPFMITATVKSVVAVIVGGLVIAFIGRFANANLILPADVRARLPALEGRLRAFVPRVMQIIRTVVTIGVVIAIAQSWGLIDFLGWLSSEAGQRISGSAIAALIVLAMGFLAYLAVSSWVEYRLNPEFGTIPTSREKTLLSLFRNAFTIALIVLVSMLALAQIGVNIAPLLAGAGVLGLAIGFGAQKLVQDIITGVFIQLENVMNEGDVVSLGSVSGVVEKLTIRSVSIRSLDGTLHLIPFSSVDTVSNMVKGFGYHVAEIGVAYREDIDEVKAAMQEAFDLLMETEWREKIIDTLDMQGITAFGDSAITVRARIKTVAGGHWGAGRAYNEFIKQVFDRRGIEIPFPHVTLYMGEDKAGKAPPLRLERAKPETPRPEGEEKLILQP